MTFAQLLFVRLLWKTINTRYPPDEWFHTYTDSSLLDFTWGAGAGIFCDLFSFYSHTTHDGKIDAINMARQQLSARLPIPHMVVILSDSSSAILTLASSQVLKSRIAGSC
ncbi:hypothetical protein TNCV_85131 [Trichonephila clavipes]|nr:hypothetical protein TNCV_85131 [Trichonephila clavipes]